MEGARVPGSTREQPRIVEVAHADEHAGVAAAQAIGSLSRVLERFPDDLQDQPLLGVHELRLARRDPEERGVETGDVVQEAAEAGGARAHPAIRAPDRRASLGEQPVEVIGTLRSGKAAADPDDGDVNVDGRRGARRWLAPRDRVGQRARQRIDRRMLEHQRGRQADAHSFLELRQQRHGLERVEPQIGQRYVRIDRRRSALQSDGDRANEPFSYRVAAPQVGHVNLRRAVYRASILSIWKVLTRSASFLAPGVEHRFLDDLDLHGDLVSGQPGVQALAHPAAELAG